MATDLLLDVRQICAGYGPARVLHELSLTVARGEALVVLGRNGVGKTTLIESLLGLTTYHSGGIWFEGRNVAFAPALHFHEALAHPQVAARSMLVEDAQGRPHLNTPLRFLHEPAQPVFHLETPAQDKVAAP